MKKILYIDYSTGKLEEEQVYGDTSLRFLYGNSYFGKLLLLLVSRFPLFSHLYGFFMKSRLSKYKVAPFIKKFSIDTSEFKELPTSFSSFNDFFIRKLKERARPIAKESNHFIAPADGRYLFYPTIDSFSIKGTTFNLESFLRSKEEAKRYEKGAMLIARLCPVDYHRYHFPCDCLPSEEKLINGYLFSVNPIAIKQNAAIYWENKRVVTSLESKEFGRVLFVEIGATNVGSIHQTYTPHQKQRKGEEKGFFSFGGSCLVLLFEPDSIAFDEKLVKATKNGQEVRCLMGQLLGNKH